MPQAKQSQTSPTVLAVIVGAPAPSGLLPPSALAVLEGLSLEQWAAAAAIYSRTQEREQRAAVAGLPPSQARPAGQAFDRLLHERYDSDPDARAEICAALSAPIGAGRTQG